MVYINNDSHGITVPTLLTKKQIQVNNITVSTDGNDVTIETSGEWKGKIKDLLEIIMEVTNVD